MAIWRNGWAWRDLEAWRGIPGVGFAANPTRGIMLLDP